MKRLTIDQTWEQCLAMWKWISRRCNGKGSEWCEDHIYSLKIEWLDANDINEDELGHDCFFCAYSNQFPGSCNNCPGSLVDEDFSCHNLNYCHIDRPRLFYAELKRLNKIRLERKRK